MHFKTEGGVTAPLGFAAMGVHAGIKKEKTDMAMIKSHVPAVAAGTFTTRLRQFCLIKSRFMKTTLLRSSFVTVVLQTPAPAKKEWTTVNKQQRWWQKTCR